MQCYLTMLEKNLLGGNDSGTKYQPLANLISQILAIHRRSVNKINFVAKFSRNSRGTYEKKQYRPSDCRVPPSICERIRAGSTMLITRNLALLGIPI